MRYNIHAFLDEEIPEFLNSFFNYLGAIKGKSPNTISGYKSDLVMFFKFEKLYRKMVSPETDLNEIKINDLDNNFLTTIKLSDLYAFISFAENYRQNGNAARSRKVASLKSFFKFICSKQKLLEKNPALELEPPKRNKRNPIYLTLEESKSLLQSIDGRFAERDYCIIVLFLNCGMRLSELCGINISKIKDDTLTIIGKGNKERTVYLNDLCLRALNTYLPVRNSLGDKIVDKDALFLSKNYRRISKRAVEVLVKKYIAKAGIVGSKYSPHKLRHTAATLMYKYGNVDIRSLQQILGHESVSTTQIYTHVDDEKLREAVKSNPLND